MAVKVIKRETGTLSFLTFTLYQSHAGYPGIINLLFFPKCQTIFSPAKAYSCCFVLCIVLIAVLSSLKLIYDIFLLLFSPFLILF